ncbi:hypothetical protein Scep_025818 [Stephania cephalantha]|uniref:Uncharacterized protein n=1 Tax=Stephania cephalantha TaxID=152367 RepID=A0AAP0HPP8_9MAGN
MFTKAIHSRFAFLDIFVLLWFAKVPHFGLGNSMTCKVCENVSCLHGSITTHIRVLESTS